jgi:hypothetical protein
MQQARRAQHQHTPTTRLDGRPAGSCRTAGAASSVQQTVSVVSVARHGQAYGTLAKSQSAASVSTTKNRDPEGHAAWHLMPTLHAQALGPIHPLAPCHCWPGLGKHCGRTNRLTALD